LALVGIGFGFWLGGGPYFESFELRRLYTAFIGACAVFSFALLLDFTLTIPPPRHPRRTLLYGPALAMIFWFMAMLFIQPEATSAVNRLSNLLLGLFAGGYFVAVLVVLAQRYRRATPEERAAGLTFMVAGTFVGLAPIAVLWLVGAVAPQLIIPGAEFAFLTLLVVPIAMAVGALRMQAVTGIYAATPIARQAARG
jgi:hypothetical protein